MAYHNTLEQQISKFFGDSSKIPSNLSRLFQEISQTYESYDKQQASAQNSSNLSTKDATVKLEFVSMVAHELRNPLTALKGYTYIMSRDYKNTFDAKQNTIMQRINISIQRLVALVENLLNITRLQKGTLTVNTESLDWIQNIDEIITEIIDQAREKKLALQFIKPQDTGYKVLVDKLRINEVLMNLLANAINYTPSGGKIAVWVEKQGNEVITHIADNGPGIPKEVLPNLFTKFFRVIGNGGQQQPKGTGLGLYISKTIVEMHKGRIWVESEVGKGAKFSFSVPLTDRSIQFPISSV